MHDVALSVIQSKRLIRMKMNRGGERGRPRWAVVLECVCVCMCVWGGGGGGAPRWAVVVIGFSK
jgi:hypothetical protein